MARNTTKAHLTLARQAARQELTRSDLCPARRTLLEDRIARYTAQLEG